MNHCPIILIHGLFGWGPGELPIPYWGTGTQIPAPMPIFEANVGPISSFHDRACELIAQIKGARVDYGEEHAKLHGHARWGKDFSGAGFYPEWDAQHPVHLVGHSAGGNTMRVAQHLLAVDFHAFGSDSTWVKSISAVSAVLNGTPLVYMLGCEPKTGLVRARGMGGVLGWAIKKAAVSHSHAPESSVQYDMDLAHWGLSFDGDKSNADRALLIESSEVFRGVDNLAYDLSMQGCYAVNDYAQTYPGTYYFGYATERTHKGPLSGQHYPNPLMSPLLIPTAAYQGWYRFSDEPPFQEWGSGQLVDELWWANDGCVPTISQYYPFINPKTAHPVHPEKGIQALTAFEAGVWYHEKIEDVTGCQWDHLDIVYGVSSDGFRAPAQRAFYAGLYHRLASLEHEDATAPTLAQVAVQHKAPCPFCQTSLDETVWVCPQCGAYKSTEARENSRGAQSALNVVMAVVALLVFTLLADRLVGEGIGLAAGVVVWGVCLYLIHKARTSKAIQWYRKR